MFAAWGRFVHRHRWLLLGASALVLGLSLAGLMRGGRLTAGTVGATEAARADRLVKRRLGAPGEQSFTLVFQHRTWTANEPRFRAALRRALAPLERDSRVARIESPLSLPPALAAGMTSADGHAVLATVSLSGAARDAQQAYRSVRAEVRPGPFHVLTAGQLAFMNDLDQTLESDLHLAELVSLPLALIVLAWVFGSLVAAALPIGVGGLAVVGGVAAVLALSWHVGMAQYTLNVVSLVGLGVAIDYSLFIVSRFRDALGGGAPVEEALARALSTAGRAVAFSGVAVGVGLTGLLFFHGSYLESMGIAGAIVVAFAVLFALTFLPALLSILGPNVNRGRLRGRHAGHGAVWKHLALWVMRRPVAVLIPTLAVLFLLGVPFFRLKVAAADVSVLPENAPARLGYQALAREFPEEAANRVLAVVEFPSGSALTPARIGALYDFSRRVARLPGVERVESVVDLGPGLDRAAYQRLAALPPRARPPAFRLGARELVGGNVAVLRLEIRGSSDSAPARRVVAELRRHRAVGDGHLLVGGGTASDLDDAAFMRERTPAAVAWVLCMTCVVLFGLLGSVVLPLKAIVMNLLSISGSFGAMVWIFQEGHGAHLLGFSPRPLEPALPVLLFCLVFGLSMDYEVLLLTRIQEDYRAFRDNTRAVAQGLSDTAGIITSAAAIMVVVFAAFGLARVVMVKAMGIGLALAVLLDATLVRVLVVPATMRLVGDWNWWAPKPVARWLAAVRLRHAAAHGR